MGIHPKRDDEMGGFFHKAHHSFPAKMVIVVMGNDDRIQAREV